MTRELRNTPNSVAKVAISGALICFGAAYSYLCGERGIFPLDQSIVFDAGYRITSGQIPYTDFVVPYGLAVFYLQAVFFKILGVSYLTYLLTGAVLNGSAVLLTILVISRLFPRDTLSSAIGGLISALWFFPSFGTPYPEHCAFLFGLVGLWLILTPSSSFSMVRTLGAGVAIGISFFCKQNIAAFVAPLIILLPIFSESTWRDSFRRILSVLCGVILSIGAIVSICVTQSSWSVFYHDTIQLPFLLGLDRFAPEILVVGRLIQNSFVVSLLVIGGMLLAWALLRSRAKISASNRSTLIACWIILYTLAVSHLLRSSILNNVPIADVYIGLVFGLVSAIVRSNSPNGRGSTGAILVVTSMIVAFGFYFSWYRKAQESVMRASFPKYLNVPRLGALRWGEPTIIKEGLSATKDPGIEVHADEIEGLVNYLKVKGGNVFFFPDFTFLYAALNVPSPQPILWFHKGLTYNSSDNKILDESVVARLRLNSVRLIVVEKRSFFGPDAILVDFPQIRRFIQESFSKTKEIGLFEIYEEIQGKENLPGAS